MSDQVLKWIRSLQQALTLESENGFRNIHGRKERFNTFVARELISLDSKHLPKEKIDFLISLSEGFEAYDSSPESARRRLVIDTRKALYSLSKVFDPPTTIKPPKLRLPNQKDYSNVEINVKDSTPSLDSTLSTVKGIGSKTIELLASLGIFTIRDLLVHYPRDYVDYSQLKRISSLEAGETATIVASIRRTNYFTSPRNPNLSVLELLIQDSTGRIKLTKFFAGRRFSNRGYLMKQVSQYPTGSTVAVSGLVKEGSYGKCFIDPIIEVLENQGTSIKSKSIGRLIPIYPLTEGLTAVRIRRVFDLVLPFAAFWKDPLPQERISHHSLMSIQNAMNQIHQPNNLESLNAARRRIVFDEFLCLQLALLRKRNLFRKKPAPQLKKVNQINSLTSQFYSLLPFSFTNEQKRVLHEIESDLESSEPMARLLQGDVGSGKTVVAIAALLYAVDSGWQGALMAPTEVLAQQHYKNLCKWLPQLHVTVDLITGSTPNSRRKQILDDLSTGGVNIIVGTHALIEDSVSFSRLGLVVVDEQHRFGVYQRDLLLRKGLQPHLLTMTATPIPRTLALSIHGDLDVSQINEMPPGREKIKTSMLQFSQRNKVFDLIRAHIKKRHQVYFVLPLVEESEKIELRSAVDVYHELSNDLFQEFNVGLLHGRMSSLDKNSTINSFVSGEVDILVSTTVIEVGVDVPNATLMVIDHADRFGLAQLHQLRGRVGRGASFSECILIDSGKNSDSRKKLEYLVGSTDGFEISEIDLRMRGPGQVLGTRQSGLPDFALANLVNDSHVLELARKEALYILNSDPELNSYKLLKDNLDLHWKRFLGNSQLN
nr:ATP-dependent DNA helicase RecG [Prochlorococcus marinus]